MERHYTALDRIIASIDDALRLSTGEAPAAQRQNPAGDLAAADLDEDQRRHVAGLMRINHTGEICAQALYAGQAATARNDATRDAIEKTLGIKALNIFGLSEMMVPGMACECLEGRHGMHIFEDHFIVETIHPETGQALPEGEEGELVFTSLTREAFPLIRYRSGDISRLIPEACRCGRTHIRMERVLKRSDDMLTIRGINIFPVQVEAILKEIEGVEPDYQLIIDKVGALDAVELQVEVGDKFFSESGGVKELQTIEKRIVKDMKDYLSISPRVKLVAPQTLKDKSKKVIDKRTI